MAAILVQMEPLVIKYAEKTFPLEFEDAKQEYYIAIIHACNKIKKPETEPQCLLYFENTVKNKYRNICKKYYSRPPKDFQDFQDIPIPTESFSNYINHLYDLFRLFYSNQIKDKYSKAIFLLSYEGYSDAEIGHRLGISRQYVHHLKGKMQSKILTALFPSPKAYSYLTIPQRAFCQVPF